MNQQLEDIKVIREMMEKSSKFLSLSGLSGITAGIAAIIGAFVADLCILTPGKVLATSHEEMLHTLLYLLADACAILLVSISAGLYFSWRKAQKNHNKPSVTLIRRTLYNLGIPLVTGGIVSLTFLLRNDIDMALAMTLVFYGLALFCVSKYTYEEVHYLGLGEIVLGVAAIIWPAYTSWLWIFGFGFFHISYGLLMYLKYDLNKA